MGDDVSYLKTGEKLFVVNYAECSLACGPSGVSFPSSDWAGDRLRSRFAGWSWSTGRTSDGSGE